MSVGWMASVAAADTYFETERLESAFWDALTSASGDKDQKTAVLLQAYNRIRRCNDFTIPTTPTAAQLAALQEAQCETAYYIAQHGKDEDRRKGLHAQGVVGANVIGETYVRFKSDQVSLTDLPFPPVVYEIMKSAGLDNTPSPIHVVEIGRDEDLGIGEDATE